MANSAATITIFPYPKGFDNTQRCQIVRGTIAVTFGTYPVGGFALSWAGLSNANGSTIESVPIAGSTPSSTGGPTPFNVDIKSVANTTTNYGTGPSGYVYAWDSSTGNMHIFVTAEREVSGNSGPLVEMAGTVPTPVVNDTIQFEAWFYRNN
jgi:hypothetical protein